MADALTTTTLSAEELGELRFAARCLEGDSFAARLARALGRRVEAAGRKLPASARRALAGASEAALAIALRLALRTIDRASPARPGKGLHKAAAAASGAIGGAFGVVSTALELPISTAILLRSIAQIARAEGEDLSRPETALACVEVFALGGGAPGEAAIESGYFAVRGALAASVAESARFLARGGAARGAPPVLARLVSQIAARFGVAVSEKLAAQAMPALGAIGGAAVNLAFAEHFQTLARGHFIVRRLERTHGAEAVRLAYGRLRDSI